MNKNRTHPIDLDKLGEDMNQMGRAHSVDLYVLEKDLSTSQQMQIETRAEPDIGKLSADAVLEQYKMAAKSVEEMGNEVQQRITALNAAMAECDADLKLLKDAAIAIREKGKYAHAEIERTAAVSKDIHLIVEQIKTKLE
jgi:hypothetical protein